MLNVEVSLRWTRNVVPGHGPTSRSDNRSYVYLASKKKSQRRIVCKKTEPRFISLCQACVIHKRSINTAKKGLIHRSGQSQSHHWAGTFITASVCKHQNNNHKQRNKNSSRGQKRQYAASLYHDEPKKSLCMQRNGSLEVG